MCVHVVVKKRTRTYMCVYVYIYVIHVHGKKEKRCKKENQNNRTTMKRRVCPKGRICVCVSRASSFNDATAVTVSSRLYSPRFTSVAIKIHRISPRVWIMNAKRFNHCRATGGEMARPQLYKSPCIIQMRLNFCARVHFQVVQGRKPGEPGVDYIERAFAARYCYFRGRRH